MARTLDHTSKRQRLASWALVLVAEPPRFEDTWVTAGDSR
jgi:hypothetical protein